MAANHIIRLLQRLKDSEQRNRRVLLGTSVGLFCAGFLALVIVAVLPEGTITGLDKLQEFLLSAVIAAIGLKPLNDYLNSLKLHEMIVAIVKEFQRLGGDEHRQKDLTELARAALQNNI